MSPASDQDVIVFDNVSKFYGEVLGVNRVNLSIPPGVTSLVGPNGSGKSTLMNLLTGLLKPSQGSIQVLGRSPSDAEAMFHLVGYCSQWDAFPKGLSGLQFVAGYLKVHGLGATEAKNKAWEAAITTVSRTRFDSSAASAFFTGDASRRYFLNRLKSATCTGLPPPRTFRSAGSTTSATLCRTFF